MKKSTLKFLKQVWAVLDGKKTYICSAIVAVLMFCKAQGWVDEPTANNLMALFAALGLASLRGAMK